jgi:hypothetical protein
MARCQGRLALVAAPAAPSTTLVVLVLRARSSSSGQLSSLTASRRHQSRRTAREAGHTQHRHSGRRSSLLSVQGHPSTHCVTPYRLRTSCQYVGAATQIPAHRSAIPLQVPSSGRRRARSGSSCHRCSSGRVAFSRHPAAASSTQYAGLRSTHSSSRYVPGCHSFSREPAAPILMRARPSGTPPQARRSTRCSARCGSARCWRSLRAVRTQTPVPRYGTRAVAPPSSPSRLRSARRYRRCSRRGAPLKPGRACSQPRSGPRLPPGDSAGPDPRITATAWAHLVEPRWPRPQSRSRWRRAIILPIRVPGSDQAEPAAARPHLLKRWRAGP